MALAVPAPYEDQPVDLSSVPPLVLIRAGLDGLRGRSVHGSGEMAAVMAEVEQVARQTFGLSIDLMAASESEGLHYLDGHGSAKIMVRHVAKLSGGEALIREKCRRMFKALPLIADAVRAGELGVDQTKLLGRVFANDRVRGAMEDRQEWFLAKARTLSFPRFEKRVLEWQRLIDEDGTEPAGERAAQNRKASMRQDPYDLTWDLSAVFPSLDGAVNHRIHQAYCKALFDLDWAEAKERVGDGVSTADLCRTDAQRSADAWSQICLDAAANANGMAPLTIDHTIEWTESAYEEMARRYAGAKPQPFNIDTYKCETIDGHPIDPTEAFANSILGNIRRVVVNAKGVVIDLGMARKFTGLARTAVQITGRECFWPVGSADTPELRAPASNSVSDEAPGRGTAETGHPDVGDTIDGKQKGYTVWRDEHGQIHTYRPDGTEIA